MADENSTLNVEWDGEAIHYLTNKEYDYIMKTLKELSEEE